MLVKENSSKKIHQYSSQGGLIHYIEQTLYAIPTHQWKELKPAVCTPTSFTTPEGHMWQSVNKGKFQSPMTFIRS